MPVLREYSVESVEGLEFLARLIWGQAGVVWGPRGERQRDRENISPRNSQIWRVRL